MTALELLRRPETCYEHVTALPRVGPGLDAAEFAPEVFEQIPRQLEIQARYAGYIERQQREIARHQRLQQTPLPDSLDYGQVRGLSNEVREKLARARPVSIGQAARISGVTPAAVSLLLVHLKRTRKTA